MFHRTDSPAAYIHIQVHLKGPSLLQSFLYSPLPLILQDTFAQGAQRPLQLLKTLHSNAITTQCHPPKFTGHHHQVTQLVQNEFLMRLCLSPPHRSHSHAGAACRDQLLLVEGALSESSSRALGFRDAPLLWRQAAICICVVTG